MTAVYTGSVQLDPSLLLYMRSWRFFSFARYLILQVIQGARAQVRIGQLTLLLFTRLIVYADFSRGSISLSRFVPLQYVPYGVYTYVLICFSICKLI